MLFTGTLPPEMPLFFGSIPRISTYIAVPDKVLQANLLAILSNIGNVIENVHTHVLVV